MAEDLVEHIQGSVVQHGHHNDRIYLMQLNTDHPETLIPVFDEMARQNVYGKISAKIPESFWRAFETAGYEKEAVIPGFFRGEVDALFIAKYLSSQRKSFREDEKELERVRQATRKAAKTSFQVSYTSINIDLCQPADAAEISSIYRQIFKSYPFPIQKAAFVERTMNAGNFYFCIRVDGKIAAMAAAEIDMRSRAAEMTDFATLPKWRGQGFASRLLRHMHSWVCDMGIQTAFTIARAASRGMNSVFRNSDYIYAGLLKNNSQICGKIESMTVWYKHLRNQDVQAIKGCSETPHPHTGFGR
jgi:putative beta-lysine N-acetyltransferase